MGCGDAGASNLSCSKIEPTNHKHEPETLRMPEDNPLLRVTLDGRQDAEPGSSGEAAVVIDEAHTYGRSRPPFPQDHVQIGTARAFGEASDAHP